MVHKDKWSPQVVQGGGYLPYLSLKVKCIVDTIYRYRKVHLYLGETYSSILTLRSILFFWRCQWELICDLEINADLLFLYFLLFLYGIYLLEYRAHKRFNLYHLFSYEEIVSVRRIGRNIDIIHFCYFWLPLGEWRKDVQKCRLVISVLIFKASLAIRILK